MFLKKFCIIIAGVALSAYYSVCNASMSEWLPQISAGYFDSFDSKTLHLGTPTDRPKVLLVVIPYSEKAEKLYSQTSKDVLIQQKLNDLSRSPSIIAPNVSDIINENLLDHPDSIGKILDGFKDIATIQLYHAVKTFFSNMLDSLSRLRDACGSDIPSELISDEDFPKVMQFYDDRIEAIEHYLGSILF